MVVNSIIFWLFFAVVSIPYFIFFRKSCRGQNLWLLLASYFFYGWADWKMIPLLIIITIVFYWLGLQIEKNNVSNPKRASHLTTLGVVLGVGVLFYFKYLGFFVQEFAHLFESFGLKTNLSTFSIIMPIGISFFTFKLISYIIETHRQNIQPTKDFVQFSTFIAFFFFLLSGPIDRPGEFIPQLSQSRTFNYDNVAEGARRIIWGLFLKVCIADRLFGYTSAILDNYTHHNATSILIASLLYSIEMYTDFSGYSEMAIGVSQILGLKVRENFLRPFFSQNNSEYWRRWHMSLTTWITDYIYMPLNVRFRDYGQYGMYLAIFINLVVIGAWHGANWTFVLFGAYHGLILVIIAAIEKRRRKFEKKYSLKKKAYYKYPRMLLTFFLVTLGLIIFRANNLSECFYIIHRLTYNYSFPFTNKTTFVFGLPFILLLIFKEFKDENKYNIHFLHSKKLSVRLISIFLLLICVFLCGNLDGGQFIYFQF